jgi:pyrimidine-nucleoside phosphorylase
MIRAQGGDPRVVADRSRLEVAPVEVVVEAPRDGTVVRADALAIGLAAVAMGAGRVRADQPVDHAVGIYVDAKPGARVVRGQPLARLRVRKAEDAAAVKERVANAFTLGDGDGNGIVAGEGPRNTNSDGTITARPLVIDRISSPG